MEFGANAMMPGSAYLLSGWKWSRIGRYGASTWISRALYLSSGIGRDPAVNRYGIAAGQATAQLMCWAFTEAVCFGIGMFAPAVVLGIELFGGLTLLYKLFKLCLFGFYMAGPRRPR